MRRPAPITPALVLSALMLAAPAMAAGISMDMPNLSFPDGKPTISTQGCDATAVEACTLRN